MPYLKTIYNVPKGSSISFGTASSFVNEEGAGSNSGSTVIYSVIVKSLNSLSGKCFQFFKIPITVTNDPIVVR